MTLRRLFIMESGAPGKGRMRTGFFVCKRPAISAEQHSSPFSNGMGWSAVPAADCARLSICYTNSLKI